MKQELLKILKQAEDEFIIDDIKKESTKPISTGNINTTLKITTKDTFRRKCLFYYMSRRTGQTN